MDSKISCFSVVKKLEQQFKEKILLGKKIHPFFFERIFQEFLVVFAQIVIVENNDEYEHFFKYLTLFVIELGLFERKESDEEEVCVVTKAGESISEFFNLVEFILEKFNPFFVNFDVTEVEEYDFRKTLKILRSTFSVKNKRKKNKRKKKKKKKKKGKKEKGGQLEEEKEELGEGEKTEDQKELVKSADYVKIQKFLEEKTVLMSERQKREETERILNLLKQERIKKQQIEQKEVSENTSEMEKIMEKEKRLIESQIEMRKTRKSLYKKSETLEADDIIKIMTLEKGELSKAKIMKQLEEGDPEGDMIKIMTLEKGELKKTNQKEEKNYQIIQKDEEKNYQLIKRNMEERNRERIENELVELQKMKQICDEVINENDVYFFDKEDIKQTKIKDEEIDSYAEVNNSKDTLIDDKIETIQAILEEKQKEKVGKSSPVDEEMNEIWDQFTESDMDFYWTSLFLNEQFNHCCNCPVKEFCPFYWSFIHQYQCCKSCNCCE